MIGGGILLGETFGGFAITYLPKVKWQVIILSIMATAFLGGQAGMTADAHATFIALGVMATFGMRLSCPQLLFRLLT